MIYTMPRMHDHTYDLYEELGALGTLLYDYHGWHTAVMENVCYPNDINRSVPDMPSLFIESLKSIPQEDISKQTRAALKMLDEQHHMLDAIASELIDASKAKDPKAHAQFTNFSELFREFMKGLQKTCQSLILEEWGLDVLTGLKNKRAMYAELSQEMERLSRHGQAFSLAIARIDDYEEIRINFGDEEADKITKQAAGFVRSALRSFDGAYNVGNGEFVLSLKQASIVGGQKALERLRIELENANVTYNLGGVDCRLSMSCCVAEPLPEDDLEQLLEGLRKDLSGHKADEGAVLTYIEMSPLQQFVKTGKTE